MACIDDVIPCLGRKSSDAGGATLVLTRVLLYGRKRKEKKIWKHRIASSSFAAVLYHSEDGDFAESELTGGRKHFTLAEFAASLAFVHRAGQVG